MSKICLSSNTSWSIYKFRSHLIKALLNKGYSVTIIAPFDDYSRKLEDLGCRFIPINIRSRGINPIGDFVFLIKLISLLVIHKPDLFITYTIKFNIYGAIASFVSGVRCLPINTGLGYTFINSNFITRIALVLYRISFKMTNQVWFLNGDDKDVFLQHNLISPQKVRLIPGEGIDTEFYCSKNAITRCVDKIRIIFIGRLIIDKGIVEFIQAAESLTRIHPNIEFCILGPYDPEYPNTISINQLEKAMKSGIINYLGVVDDARDSIETSDIVVLPSYREGVPRVLLEAASLAKPIVTTNTPGCREVVTDGVNGLLCNAKDAIDLTNKLNEMINFDCSIRAEMGSNGRKKVISEFDNSIVIKHYFDYINSLSL